jgi:ATP-dependent protease ClpP protease subunit
MPSWNEVLNEIQAVNTPGPLDVVRRKYLKLLHEKTGRNVIAYYSAFVDRPRLEGAEINDSDINGLMAMCHGLDKTKGLDLILHTPGGELAAAEAIVTYLKKLFGNDIRAIVPQIAMSAGTMIACSCSSIMMGKQSSIGPIDPQLNGFPAQGVIDEFQDAIDAVHKKPETIEMWKTIVGKYPPTYLGECRKAILLSKGMVKNWLMGNMLNQDPNKDVRAQVIVDALGDHNSSMMHSRHIDAVQAKQIGLVIDDMEADHDLQDKILTVHHAFMATTNQVNIKKIIENHRGIAMVQHFQPH